MKYLLIVQCSLLIQIVFLITEKLLSLKNIFFNKFLKNFKLSFYCNVQNQSNFENIVFEYSNIIQC